jgi:hypothetical protein
MSTPRQFTLGRKFQYYRGLGGPWVSLDWSGKPPTTGVQTRSLQPVANRYSDWTIPVAVGIKRETHKIHIYFAVDNGELCQLMTQDGYEQQSCSDGVEESCHLQHWVVLNVQGIVPPGHVATLVIIYQDYIHKVPVILRCNLHCESHTPYGPPTSVTLFQLLRKRTNTGTSTSLTAEAHWSTRTRLRALSLLLTSV